MTKDGVTKLIMTMLAAYPNYHPADISATVRVWMAQLENYTDEEIAIALKAYILSDTRGFAPSIGQVVALVPRNQDSGLSELEAWGLVRMAVRNGNYGSEEEFAKLPDNIRAAVGSPGQIRQWAAVSMDELETVAQSNFLRSYREVEARDRMARKMPERLREIYHRAAPDVPALESRDEEKPYEGIPMPEKYKARLRCITKEA